MTKEIKHIRRVIMERKEAIEVIKKNWPDSSYTMLREALEILIPELKESEDERIREAIIKCLKWLQDEARWTDVYGISFDSIFAWIEKQGKNNMGISEATKKKLENSLNEALEKETPESWNKFLDEQGEQKPVTNKYNVGATIYYKSFDGIKSMVVANVIDAGDGNPMYEDADGNGVFEKDLILQMHVEEQKPAWSEEDEKQARQIERIVHDDGCTQKLQKQIADWLKSLKDRYTWKPTDEQMEALRKAEATIGVNHVVLAGLISDLEKLTEVNL